MFLTPFRHLVRIYFNLNIESTLINYNGRGFYRDIACLAISFRENIVISFSLSRKQKNESSKLLLINKIEPQKIKYKNHQILARKNTYVQKTNTAIL